MRRYFFEILTFILVVGSLGFFVQAVSFLSRRDYLAAVLVTLVGFAVLRVGGELARLALAERE